MAHLVVVKLGGALLTDKSERRSLRREALAPLAASVAAIHALRPPGGQPLHLCVIHGAGSFGHFEAREHRLNSTAPADATHQTPLGVARCRASLAQLNAAVVDALVDAGVPAVTVPAFPGGGVHRGAGQEGNPRGYARTARDLVARGFVPVIHGDPVLADPGLLGVAAGPPPAGRRAGGGEGGACCRTSVVSGDEVARVLAAAIPRLGAGAHDGGEEGGAPATSYAGVHVLFATGAPGVFSAPPPPWLLAGGPPTPPPEREGDTDGLPRGGAGAGCEGAPRLLHRVVVACRGEGGVDAVGAPSSGAPAGIAVPPPPQGALASTPPPHHDHHPGVADVTGGIVGKLGAAAAIAQLGCRRGGRDGAAVSVTIVGGRAAADDLLAAARALLQPGAAGGAEPAAGLPGTRVVCSCARGGVLEGPS